MKFCPVCQTRYDEEIIKFCTKDGTPLVQDNPTFTAMPSQSSVSLDEDQETVIRRKEPVPNTYAETAEKTSQRVVIPMQEERKPTVRPLENPPHQQTPPRKSNTALIVLLTVLGTLVVLGGAGGVFWFLQREDTAANTNENVANANFNNNGSLANFNTNANANINANSNLNTNTNANTNANVKTPTPTPTKTPTPTPTPDANTNTNVNTNTATPINSNTVTNSRPVNTTPSATPRVSPSAPGNQTVNVGVINSRATALPKPAYPPLARQMRVSGEVSVNVTVDENGNVMSARAVSGHALLRPAAEAAARQSRFNPVKVGNQNVRANGTIVYNFINN